MSWPRPAALVAALLLSLAPTVHAATIEKLVMPGPVTQAHSRLEADCDNCHDRTDRNRQSALCLACHEEIAADIRSATRYHGRMPNAAAGQCRGCHTEHHGRAADMNKLDPAGFEHDLTRFPLQGAHLALNCVACHKPAGSYRKTPAVCADCHRDADVHRGALGTECSACHTQSAWTQAHFDHDTTRYPLVGKHRDAACATCHFGERYKGIPTQCAACHAPDDVHRGSQGRQCENCHTPQSWATQRFDHARETGFALNGRHARIGCADCHRSGDLHAPVPKDCGGCHQSDDRHASRFGPTCADCHGEDTWQVANFDHTGRFGFALTGAHASLDCHACHTAEAATAKLGTDCVDCHRADEPHGKTLGRRCDDCHADTKWPDVTFDHDQSAFPLLGLHTIVTCGQCHPSQRFGETPKDCIACHRNVDVHKGALGTDCAQCHSANGWMQLNFDHGAHTRFALTGAHAHATCADCHLRPQNQLKPSMICGSCHAGDDLHGGRFGVQCQQCHTSSTFARPRAIAGPR